jgi:hypothetical protein
MITQAIKRWLNKLFGWLSWKQSPETEYTRAGSSLNKGVTQESAAWPTNDGITPQSGVSPLILGQGETSCSTIDEWPKSVIQPPPPTANEEVPPASSTPAQLPMTPPDENAKTAIKNNFPEASSRAVPPPKPPVPSPEQKLEFLHYLVKRGIVNEGFAEGQVPEQYRK